MRGVILAFLQDYRAEAKSLPKAAQALVEEVASHQIELVKEMLPAVIADLFSRAQIEAKAAEIEDMLGPVKGE